MPVEGLLLVAVLWGGAPHVWPPRGVTGGSRFWKVSGSESSES
jgi:hypothetical protein